MATWRWREPLDDERTPTGLSVAGGVVVVVGTAAVVGLVTHAVGWRLGALMVAVLLFTAAVGDGRAAAGVAVIAWAVGNGFLINRFGELRWHRPVDNWFAMGLLGAVAVGMIVAEVRGQTYRRRRWRPWRNLLEAAAEHADRADPFGDGSRGSSPVSGPAPRHASADAAPDEMPR